LLYVCCHRQSCRRHRRLLLLLLLLLLFMLLLQTGQVRRLLSILLPLLLLLPVQLMGVLDLTRLQSSILLLQSCPVSANCCLLLPWRLSHGQKTAGRVAGTAP
jgi:hypothetical protein